MSTTGFGSERVTDAWNQLYDVLAAEPRRMIIFSLMKAPNERELPLPDAAQSKNQQTDSRSLRVQLYHNHLPKLAEAGYIRWKRDPLRVRRGPNFDEPALVIAQMTDNKIQYPERLREECVVIGELAHGEEN